MDTRRSVARVLAARTGLRNLARPDPLRTRSEAEGGCGVIGIACSVPIAGRHLLQSLIQMRNRGNGKGGGVAMAGLNAAEFGVSNETLRDAYLLAVAYLDPSARQQVETEFVQPMFDIDRVREFVPLSLEGVETQAPHVVCYFASPRAEALSAFQAEHALGGLPPEAVQDEFVYQNTFRLNSAYYASLGEQRAFVLSHGKDLLVLKMVGYGDDVVRTYQLEDSQAHVWIGHHRYPTKGRVWHPGGAHPFVGLHEALVHNGDFANYASVCSYLAQSNIYPLFLTDTEVSVLVFDLLHRTFGYPLEYVIEALAPTTERDFAMLPESKQEIYRKLQTVHIHGSPDGPWFFLIAQSRANGLSPRTARLIGITDTSMLRPQVFALQQGRPGEPSIGFAASEKQAIDAALADLAAEDDRFWSRADRVWNARGGSHTDGGAFLFSVVRADDGSAELSCTDKFGGLIKVEEAGEPFRRGSVNGSPVARPASSGEDLFAMAAEAMERWSYDDLLGFLESQTADEASDSARQRAIKGLSLMIDRRYPTGSLRRSSILALCDQALYKLFKAIQDQPSDGYVPHAYGKEITNPSTEPPVVVLDALGFDSQGRNSLSAEIVKLFQCGYGEIIVFNARGHRFIASGLGPRTDGLKIDVYGSPGDYLGSGIDGATVTVHGSGQDQLAQIMKRGRLAVYGDVGQTFMYAAKGGEAFILGNAAGRPLINAVGRPRVVINGTCLDYLAESFMAGDPMNGGGFVILNGVKFDVQGSLVELPSPYPGGNLFSLASGGAIFARDPHGLLGEDQLNGGRFAPFEAAHWHLIRPQLEENERLFGVRISDLLSVGGELRSPGEIYRVILPAGHKVLQPEEAWVAHS